MEENSDSQEEVVVKPVIVGETFDVNWSPAAVAEFGSAVEAYPGKVIRYHLQPTWRSQFKNVMFFFIFSVISVIGSDVDPAFTVIRGPLFSIGGVTYYLYLPWLIFLPGFFLGKALINIYDADYVIDARGIEAKIGLVSLSLRQPRLRFEDIRGVEPFQTIWARIFGIGDLDIGSAMKEEVEITMRGIANPRAVQLFISGEIERSLKRITQSAESAAKAGSLVARGD
jgi:uncharacterized membrane protein YdbT with pleckstrin-like domain